MIDKRTLSKEEKELQMRSVHSLVKMGYNITDIAPRFGSTPANLRACYQRYLIKLKKEKESSNAG